MRPVLCPRLIDRAEEVEEIGAVLEEAGRGRGGSVVLLGEAGVGKSRLAREAEAMARQRGLRTLWGRSLDGSSTTAYRPIAEALLSAVRAGPLPDAPELRPFRPMLARLVPDWREAGDAPGDDSLVLFGEAVLRLLRVLGSERGCLLVLEDLHWADCESLGVLEHLAGNLAAEPVVAIATVRSDEASPALSLARSLQARRASLVLDLPRLDGAAVRAMAAACLGDVVLPEPIAQQLETSADGLPLVVEDLLAEWANSGSLRTDGGIVVADLPTTTVVPVTFAETIRRRLRALGDDGARLLRVAAMLGRRFDWRLLPAAADMDEERTLALLHAAVGAQLIVAEGSGARATFHFRHALTQAAILEELLPPERARLAACLVAVVERVSPGLPGEVCDLAARLAEEAGDSERAASFLLESGRRSLAAGALATAETTLDRARALCATGSPLSTDVNEVLVEALALAGKHGRVFAVGEELLARLRQAGDAEREAEAHIRLARAALAARKWERLAEHLEAARALTSAVGPRADALAAQAAIEQGRVDDAAELARRALAAAERDALPAVACESFEVIGRAARRFDLGEAEAAFDQARPIAEQHGLTVWRVRALHELGTVDLFRDSIPGRLIEARELAEHCGALATAAMVDVQLAAIYEGRFELDAAFAAASRAAEAGARFGLPITRALGLLFHADINAERGDRGAVEAVIPEILRLAGDRSEMAAMVWHSRAKCSLTEDNRARALEELETGHQLLRGMAIGAPDPGFGMWALLRTIEGRDGPAARAEVRDSYAMVQPINQAYLRYADAVELGRAGRRAEAQAAVEADDASVARLPWYQHLGRRLVAEAAIQDGWGEPAAWLAEGLEFFERSGLEQLATACRSLLRRCGVAVGRAPDGLSPALRAAGVSGREAEVLELIGEGLSNKAIADRLYLSPRTVERHVASLMDKLERRSRAQLAAFVARL